MDNNREMLALLEELTRRAARKDISKWFPDEGEYRRELYPKHAQFFRMGVDHRERLLMAANRVGKTIAGGYETALHATGLYPEWWDGWTVPQVPGIWVAGRSTETTRDIVQHALFGPTDNIGSGMIPKRLIGEIKKRPNTNDAFDYVNVKNERYGGWCRIGFKSYEQGSRAFEGTAKHWIWLDEEPPLKIYTECLTRTATTDGRIGITFTPLEGITEVVRSFMEEGVVRV